MNALERACSGSRPPRCNQKNHHHSFSDSEDNNDSCRKFKTGYIEFAHFSMLKIYLRSDLYGGDIPAGQRIICECRLRGTDDEDGRLEWILLQRGGESYHGLHHGYKQRSGSNSRA